MRLQADRLTCLARIFPKVSRANARLHIISSALSAIPMRRMQWWIRPGPSRPWAISNPRPSPEIDKEEGGTDYTLFGGDQEIQ